MSWRCFWEDYGQNYGTFGSYFYHNSWYCYDNILLSSDLIESYGVITDGIVTTIDGKPNRWNRQTMEGVSDHLPVWVKVKLR